MSAMTRSIGVSVVLGLSAIAGLSACGSDGHGEDHLLCFGDENPASAGTALVGDMGNLKVHVVSIAPNPLIVGENSVTLRITDTSDQAVAGATVTAAEVYQRVHDHGTPSVPEFTSLANDGEVRIDKLGVVHTGSWYFRFNVEAGGNSDFVEFTFGIDCPAELNEG